MVPASELAQIQADAAYAACDQSCVIQRPSRSPRASGGASQQYSPIATVLAGMSQPTAGQLQNYGYMVGDLSAWQVKFPVGTTVQEQDHLIISGQTLNVVKLLNPRSYPALLTVLAVEVKG